MSSGTKRSSFQITSVTSDLNQNPTGKLSPCMVLTLSQSDSSSQGSSSQPTTPSLKRKYSSHDASGSRFRVVRLGVGGASDGRGEPYHRGRWTCLDFRERQGGLAFRRVMDSMRHAHSLESLEMIGRNRERGGVHSHETACLLTHPIRSGPPSPMHQETINIRIFDHKEPVRAQGLDSTPLPPSLRPRHAPPPLRLDVDAAGRSVLRLSQSQPSSPPAGPYHSTLTPRPTPAAFSLDQTISDLPGDTSSSTHSLTAIDNKIEQAMDLVKSHLMMAVKEEVELLREQIRGLQERNQQLERENHILRALTHNLHTA